MQAHNFGKADSFSVFQNTNYCKTIFLSKQLYFQSRVDYKTTTWNSYFFYRNNLSRILSYLEQLLLPNKYSLVTNTFFDQLLFENKYFFSATTVSEKLFLLNMYLYIACTFSEQVHIRNNYLFGRRNFLGNRYILKTATFCDNSTYSKAFILENHFY